MQCFYIVIYARKKRNSIFMFIPLIDHYLNIKSEKDNEIFNFIIINTYTRRNNSTNYIFTSFY